MEMENTFYLNSKNNSELTDRIFQMVNSAQIYIKTGNFLFKDDKLNTALKKAEKRGVAIFILTNIQGSEHRGASLSNLKQENDPHLPNLHNLHHLGIHVRCNADLHAKFLLCDGKDGLIMSSNYTFNSLYENLENGLDISGKELIDLEYVFDTLYLHPDVILSEDVNKYRYLQQRNPIQNSEMENIGSGNLLRITACGDKNIRTNLGTCNVHTIYDSIIDIINRATERLYIVSWSYNDLRELKDFQQALKNALKRDVRITILYSNEASDSGVKRTEEQLNTLCSHLGTIKKPTIKAFPSNHSKCVLSEKEGIMFTANIDGSRGLLKGFELGCILNDNQRAAAILKINKTLK